MVITQIFNLGDAIYIGQFLLERGTNCCGYNLKANSPAIDNDETSKIAQFSSHVRTGATMALLGSPNGTALPSGNWTDSSWRQLNYLNSWVFSIASFCLQWLFTGDLPPDSATAPHWIRFINQSRSSLKIMRVILIYAWFCTHCWLHCSPFLVISFISCTERF